MLMGANHLAVKQTTALIVPSTDPRNRGDAALALESVRLARKCGFSRVLVTADDEGSLSQLLDGGSETVRPVVQNVRRSKFREDVGFHDSWMNLVRLSLSGMRELAIMVSLLLFCNRRRMLGKVIGRHRVVGLEAMRSADVVLVKGGGFIHSFGGPRWAYYLLHQLFPVILATRLGKTVVVLPNSFGPFRGRLAQWIVFRALKKCTLVTAREHVSAKTISALIGRPVAVYPDLAFALEPAQADWARRELYLRGIQCEDLRCVGFTVRNWRFPGHAAPYKAFCQYLDSMVHLVRVCRSMGFKPVLFEHALGPSKHEDDRVAVAALIQRMGPEGMEIPRVGSEGYTPAQLAALYGQMRAMVATRFHSAIFAALSSVPSMVVAYGGNKGIGIMGDMGLGEYVIPIENISPEASERVFRSLVSNIEEVRKQVRAYVESCSHRLNELVMEVQRMVGLA